MKPSQILLLLFVLAVSGACRKLHVVNITKIELYAKGIDTLKPSGERYIQIVGKEEIIDTNIIRQFQKIKKWKTSPNYKCARNACLVIKDGENTIDSINAVLSNDCGMIEILENNKTNCRKIPDKTSKALDSIFHKIKVCDGCLRL